MTDQLDRGVLVAPNTFSEADRARVLAAAGDLEVHFGPVADVAPERVVGVTSSVTPAIMAASPRLRWVHSPAAGVNHDLTAEMVASDIVLTSSAGNGAIPLAEHSMLLMMMLNRDVPRWAAAQREHRWDRFTHGELAGLTLGIFGVGNAGRDLALKAKAFHMEVIGCRRNADRAEAGVDEMYPMSRLHDFLARSDMVVVTAPATPETQGVFDEAAFRAMKPTAFWICISRGGIADDTALLRALEEGWIAGAGLDAHGVEPLPADSPFWEAPHTVITPHNGATTSRTAARGVDILVENVRRFAAGEPLVNIVDKAAGY